MNWIRIVLGNTLLILLLCLPTGGLAEESCLGRKIAALIKNKRLEIGMAVYDVAHNESFSWNGDKHFPMQSVYKFPIAMAVLHKIDCGKLSYDELITVNESFVYTDLWSPMSKKYPHGVTLPLSELLKYMLVYSDNAATDCLLNLIGGPAYVQKVIIDMGANQLFVRHTEREMQADWDIQFMNSTTPNAMIDFLKIYQAKEHLSAESSDRLWKLMGNIATGSIRKYLPQDITVFHKTGFSGTNTDGVIAAQNDVGIIELEDGSKLLFSIFITHSKESSEVGYELIAELGKAIYECYKKAD